MKRLILFELMILFLATTFESDSPPGWFQQTLPVNDIVNDIFFIDSSNGWLITEGDNSGSDTAYIMHTSNSGNNWNLQFTVTNELRALQFVNNLTGYISGGTGTGTARVFKTTDGGINWSLIFSSVSGNIFTDLFFINADTGWVCDADNISGLGLQKTTNGGLSWFQQLPTSYGPSKLFFLNKDTGWVASNFSTGGSSKELYRTTNGGDNWSLQFTFSSAIGDIYFLNKDFGIITSGINQRSTDGGFTWIPSLNSATGLKLDIVSDSVIFAGLNFIYIVKSTNGGKSWFSQTSSINNNQTISAIDTNIAWAGGSGVVHTTDGGGPPVGIQQTGTEIPSEYKLFQNYPNPFNPKTNIKYSVKRETSNVKLIVYDIQGKIISQLVDQKQSAGIYVVDWNATGFSSGIYFYSLIIDGKLFDTRKMILIK